MKIDCGQIENAWIKPLTDSQERTKAYYKNGGCIPGQAWRGAPVNMRVPSKFMVKIKGRPFKLRVQERTGNRYSRHPYTINHRRDGYPSYDVVTEDAMFLIRHMAAANGQL